MAVVTHKPEHREPLHSLVMRTTSLVILAGSLIVLLAGQSAGQMPPAASSGTEDFHTGLWGKSALGGYLGPWISSNLTSSSADANLKLTANATAFHMEFFYQPRLTGIVNLDLNVGAISRGEMRIQTATQSSYGTATIYPIGFGVRLAPFAKSVQWGLQPIIRLGGTLLVGTEQFESALTYPDGTYYGTSIQSRWGLGFYGGAGVAWVLGERFAMSACVKYQNARFTRELFGAKDYSGIQVLVGAMYLYRPVVHRRFNH